MLWQQNTHPWLDALPEHIFGPLCHNLAEPGVYSTVVAKVLSTKNDINYIPCQAIFRGVVEFTVAPKPVPRPLSWPFLSSASSEKCPPTTGLAMKVTGAGLTG